MNLKKKAIGRTIRIVPKEVNSDRDESQDQETAEKVVEEVIKETIKKEEVKPEPKIIIDDEKPFTIRFTAKELKNTRIRNAVLALIDLKAREQRHTRFVLISQSEHDILEKYNPSFMVPWKRYAKSKKELVYEGEVGKYLGKRLVVIE